jgi:hypothetical protein
MTGDPKAVKSLRAYYKNREIDTAELLRSIDGESDRSAVVMAASVLEDTLLLALFTRFPRAATPDELGDQLAQHDGPLGSFSKKIAVAHMMGLVSDKSRKILTLIRELRNACAHSQRPISFETPQVQAVVHRMLYDTPVRLRADAADRAALRAAFLAMATALIVNLLDRVLAYQDELLQQPEPQPSPDKPLPQPTQPDRGSRTAHTPSSPPPSSQAWGLEDQGVAGSTPRKSTPSG